MKTGNKDPIGREEIWKAAHRQKDGKYITPEAEEIGKKIVSSGLYFNSI